MASSKSASLDKWRDYFRTLNYDIFEIIEHAIRVAASDCPKEFRIQRDKIAETLFSCKVSKCVECNRISLVVPRGDGECIAGFERDGGCGLEDMGGSGKGSNLNSSRGDDREGMNENHVCNYSYGDAEALSDEIEEENQIYGEVMRIKRIVDNSPDESDSVLYDSLRRLQVMALSVETLKATEIGKSVNALRKHASKETRHLARTLVEEWKEMVDEWVNNMAAVAVSEATPESVNPSVLDEEEGLPSPPLDDLAFFSSQETSIELSRFFDGMDEEGNPYSSGEFHKNRESGRQPLENNYIPKLKQQHLNESNASIKDVRQEEQMKKEETLTKKQPTDVKPNKPPIGKSGPGRPTNPSMQQIILKETRVQKKSIKTSIPKRPVPIQHDKSRCTTDEAAVEVKLEATKRKLQERYLQVENAKRQRTIQVMELRDLPKHSVVSKNPNARPGNGHNRHWAKGRR